MSSRIVPETRGQSGSSASGLVPRNAIRPARIESHIGPSRDSLDTNTSKIKSPFNRGNEMSISARANASNPEIMQNLRALLPLMVIAISAVSCTPSLLAQTASCPRSAGAPAEVTLPDDPSVTQATTSAAVHPSSAECQQTKRILFIIPTFRSVSVDAKLPPLSPGDKFKLMLQDSFDYSSFIYVGILAGVGQAQNSYPAFHQGAAGYGRYYWHSFADNLGGNLMTEALVPTLTREDPRYYTLGRGGFVRRTGYSISRLFVTRTDGGGATFNMSEIVGNG